MFWIESWSAYTHQHDAQPWQQLLKKPTHGTRGPISVALPLQGIWLTGVKHHTEQKEHCRPLYRLLDMSLKECVHFYVISLYLPSLFYTEDCGVQITTHSINWSARPVTLWGWSLTLRQRFQKWVQVAVNTEKSLTPSLSRAGQQQEHLQQKTHSTTMHHWMPQNFMSAFHLFSLVYAAHCCVFSL